MAIAYKILLKNSVRFGHFQFYAGQFVGLNQTLILSGHEKANKNFQPNFVSGPEKFIWISIKVKDQ